MNRPTPQNCPLAEAVVEAGWRFLDALDAYLAYHDGRDCDYPMGWTPAYDGEEPSDPCRETFAEDFRALRWLVELASVETSLYPWPAQVRRDAEEHRDG